MFFMLVCFEVFDVDVFGNFYVFDSCNCEI